MLLPLTRDCAHLELDVKQAHTRWRRSFDSEETGREVGHQTGDAQPVCVVRTQEGRYPLARQTSLQWGGRKGFALFLAMQPVGQLRLLLTHEAQESGVNRVPLSQR